MIYSSVVSPQKTAEFADRNIIKVLDANRNNTSFYYPRNFDYLLPKGKVDKRSCITYVCNNTSAGAIVINLSHDRLKPITDLSSDASAQTSAIISADGMVLSHSNPNMFAKNVSEEKYFSEILKSRNTSGSFKYFGTRVSYIRSSYLGFYYIKILNISDLFVNLYRPLILIFIFVLLLIILFAAASMFIILKPSEVPEENVKNETGKPEVKRPIRYNFLSDKRNGLIKKLLIGTLAYSPDDLHECGIIFSKPHFGVVVARIDRLKSIEPANVPIIKYGITNIGNEVFGQLGNAYGIEPDEYDVAWIINYESYQALIPAVEQVQSFVENVYKITASFGCNFGADSIEDISDLFHNSQYSLSYRLSMGYNSIILYNSIKDKEQNCEYPKTLERSIISDIQTQNTESMKENLHKFMEAISDVPYPTVIKHASRLFNEINKIQKHPVNNVESMIGMETGAEIENFIFASFKNLLTKNQNGESI